MGYSNLCKVQELIDDGKPLSVLQESQFIRDVVYVVISGNNCVHLHEINCDDVGGQYLYNLWFTKVTINVQSSLSLERMQSIDFNTITPCLSVSRFYDSSHFYNFYSNEFKLPWIPKSINMFVNKNI